MIGESSSVLFCVGLLLTYPCRSHQHGYSSGSLSGSSAQSYSSSSASSFASSSAFSTAGSFGKAGSIGNEIGGPLAFINGLQNLGAQAAANSFAAAGSTVGAIPSISGSYRGTKGGAATKAEAILKRNGLGVGGGIGLDREGSIIGTGDYGSAAIKSNCGEKPCGTIGPALGTGHLPLDNGPDALETGGLSDYATDKKTGIGPYKPSDYTVKTNSGAGVGGGIGIGAGDTFLGGSVKHNEGCTSPACRTGITNLSSDIKPVVEESNGSPGGLPSGYSPDGFTCSGIACLQFTSKLPKMPCKNGGCLPDSLHFPGPVGDTGSSQAFGGSFSGPLQPGIAAPSGSSSGFASGNVIITKPGHTPTSIHFESAPENVHGISSSTVGEISANGPGYATGSDLVTKPHSPDCGLNGCNGGSAPASSHPISNKPGDVPYLSTSSGTTPARPIQSFENNQPSFPTASTSFATADAKPGNEVPNFYPSGGSKDTQPSVPAVSYPGAPNKQKQTYPSSQETPHSSVPSCGSNREDCSPSNAPKETYPSIPGQSFAGVPSCGPNGVGCGSPNIPKQTYPSLPSTSYPSVPFCGPNGGACGLPNAPKETFASIPSTSHPKGSSCGPNDEGCGSADIPKQNYPSTTINSGVIPSTSYSGVPSCSPNGAGCTSPNEPRQPYPSTPTSVACGGFNGGGCSNQPAPATDLEAPPANKGFGSYAGPFPGPSGSIYESKPAKPGSKPVVTISSPVSPATGPIPSIPSTSNAIADDGFHYTGPFPGPTGSIYNSKPVGKPASPNYSNQPSNYPGSSQFPNLVQKPLIPGQQAQPEPTHQKPHEGGNANPHYPSNAPNSQHPYTPTSQAHAGVNTGVHPNPTSPTGSGYKPESYVPNQVPDSTVHYTGPFPGPTGSIYESRPVTGASAGATASAGSTAGVQYTPQYQPGQSATKPTQYPNPTAGSPAQSGGSDSSVHYTGPLPGRPGSIYESKPASINPGQGPIYSGATATAGSTAGTIGGLQYSSQHQPVPTAPDQYSSVTAGAAAGSGTQYTGTFPGPTHPVPTSKPFKGSYGIKTHQANEPDTDKPIIHIIPTPRTTHEVTKVTGATPSDNNLVPGDKPEIYFGVSDININPVVNANANAISTTGATSGCSSGNCQITDVNPNDITLGCSGTGCGSYSGAKPSGIQPPNSAVAGSGAYSSTGAINGGGASGSHGCGTPACAVGNLGNAFGSAFAGAGSYSGTKGGSYGGSKSGAYASSSSGSFGIPFGGAAGAHAGSFASSFASAGASASAGHF